VRFVNSIVADNSAPGTPNTDGCSIGGGTFTSLGYNLEDGDTCNLSEPTDIINTDPMLEQLGDNGGETETHALPDDSPAADQGSCPGVSADQRGMPRPVDLPGVPDADDGCDIGAYEAQEDLTSPEIVATVPVSGAVDVPLAAPVVITFSEPISTGTFAYTVDPDPGGLTETWMMSDTLVTLGHAPFAVQTAYTVTVSAAEDLVGNPLAGAPYAWDFTTTADVTSPQVLAVSPISGAMEVALEAPVVITFSEPIDTGTFGFTVAPDPGEWAVGWMMSDTLVTLDHAPLDADTVYTVTVEAAADLVGNPLAEAPVAWSFTTELHRLYLPMVLRNGP
jgi:hypothetical protein